MRHPAMLLALAAIASAAPVGGRAPAQDATVIGRGTVLPGSGPGTATDGSGGGRMLQAPSAEDATRRRNVRPATFLASAVIGIPVRDAAGDEVGTIENLLVAEGGTLRAVIIDVSGPFTGKRIAVEPSALVLRPGGARYAAVLNLARDTIAAAQPFDPAQAGLAP